MCAVMTMTSPLLTSPSTAERTALRDTSSPVPRCAVAAGYRASSDIPCTGDFEGGGGFERHVPAVRGTVVSTLFSSWGRSCFGGNGHQCGRLANHYEQKRMTRLVAAALMTGWLVKGAAIA